MAAQTLTRIKNGPSKFDLMLALFDRPSGKMPRRVEFSDEHGNRYEAFISSVEVGTGPGESWKIKGFLWPMQTSAPSARHVIFYRTDTRIGHFEPIE